MKKEYYDFSYSGDQIKALLEKIDKELKINKFGYVEVNNTDNKLYFYTDSSKSKLVASVALPIPEIIDNLNTTDKDKTLSANQGKILKDLVDKSAGIISENSGEIFNDYSNQAEGSYSHVEGKGNISGIPAFAIKSINPTAKTIQLDDIGGGLTITYYLSVGNVLNAANREFRYMKFGKITAIDDDTNTITVDGFIHDNSVLPDATISSFTHIFIVKEGRVVPFQKVGNRYCLGDNSHAEGLYVVSGGISSHAEGQNTYAIGDYSHAEGDRNLALGQASHVEGYYNRALSDYQHVEGKHNVEDDSNKYIHIVGNGEGKTKRSNAHTLDWNGNAWYQGNIKIGGTSYDDENAKELITKEEALNKFCPKHSASDYPISVSDHLEGEEVIDYKVYGNSVQETRSGKNLLSYPYSETTKTENGVTFTDNGDGTITVSGTATDDVKFYCRSAGDKITISSGTYTMSGCPNGGSATTYYIGGFSYNVFSSGQTFTVTDTTSDWFYIAIKSGATVNNLIFKPQLELGSTATEYEQYGAMPSPDYPSEIQSVGDLVTDETSKYYGKYDVPVTVRGKNLFDTERWYNELYAIETSHTGDYAVSKTDEYIQLCAALGKSKLKFMEGEFETNTQYSISVQIMNVTANNVAGLLIYYTDGTWLDIRAFKTDTSWKDISVVTSEGKTISCIVINSYSPSTVFRIKNIQLEKGTTATSYEPYTSETKHIYLDAPLRKVGDYADYVDFENQKVVRQIKYIRLEPTLNYKIWAYNDVFYGFLVSLTGSIQECMVLSNYFKPMTDNTLPSYKDNSIYLRDVLYIGTADWTTVDDFKAWLSDNIAYVAYVLKTPTEEPITVPELTTPNSAVMNVSSGTAIQPSQIDLTYYQDINKVITNLTNAILAQGGNV